MKSKILTTIFLFYYILLTLPCFSQGAAINTTGAAANPSAMLDVSSVNSGILIPRMTEVQKNLINSPAIGLMIYQTDGATGFWYYDGAVWVQSIGVAGAIGATGVTGANGATGVAGATGLLSPGTSAGNTPYWDGIQWVVNSSNIFNNGGSVGIGTNTPDASSKMEIASTNSGLLIPRMTTAERNLIPSPAEGLQIFNTVTKCFEFFAYGKWEKASCGFNCGVENLVDSRDGQIYATVQIGSQCWMKENLKYLPIVHSNSEFVTQATNSEPGYGVYNYDGNSVATAKSQANYSIYGVLYNWHAAITACPTGWHLSSDAEWQTLEMFLGMSYSEANNTGWRGTDEGGKLKEVGTSYWTSPNTGANNSSGFSALPSGYRGPNGPFGHLSNYGGFWSATVVGTSALRRYVGYNISTVLRGTDIKGYGFAVRCLRD